MSDPLFYLTAIPAVLIYGIGKGGLGGALGVVAVPMMALTVPVQQAAAILLPTLLAMDVFAVRYHYKFADYCVLKMMIMPALIGILLAGIYMKGGGDREMEFLVGIISLLFVILYLVDWLPKKKPGTLSAYFWSLFSGFTSTTIHSGGGPASIYLLPLKLDKRCLVATMAVFFASVNFFKLIPYLWLDLLSLTNISTALTLIPLAPVGVAIGARLLDVVSETWVYRLCYTFLFLSGVALIWRAW
ncbi:hypothetical protein CS022_03485 [Veronia nyctiphanis]|uniref:Probable membrane transporter protein n=1 Tax=Veronia nyctiphanis TaxID=1278244 RepID=A0A4Q0YV49_9GAMM|nr:hypothetical protein CS022_03485 [Veronia nyctiphanis]